MIGSGEISEAFTEMIEVWSVTEPDEEGWPEVSGIDLDAIDEWTDKWAQAAKLMAIVGSADHRDIAFTARMHLKVGFARLALRTDRSCRRRRAVGTVRVAHAAPGPRAGPDAPWGRA